MSGREREKFQTLSVGRSEGIKCEMFIMGPHSMVFFPEPMLVICTYFILQNWKRRCLGEKETGCG